MVIFFIFSKGKLLAMQFSKVLLKSRSHHTTQTRLSESKGFPTLTARPQQFTIQRVRRMLLAQVFSPLYTKRTMDISARSCAWR